MILSMYLQGLIRLIDDFSEFDIVSAKSFLSFIWVFFEFFGVCSELLGLAYTLSNFLELRDPLI